MGLSKLKPSQPKPQNEPLSSSSKHYIIGCDPGLSGAVAILDLRDSQIAFIADMPIYSTHSSSRKSGIIRHIDIECLSDTLSIYAPNVLMAFVEAPGAMPNQGLSSTFRFGKFCGQVEGILAGLGIYVKTVSPAVWKAVLGLSRSKEESLQMARKYFPKSLKYWQLKKHNDRAEAALLAFYGALHLKEGAKLTKDI